jgi:hypothetical protein
MTKKLFVKHKKDDNNLQNYLDAIENFENEIN